MRIALVNPYGFFPPGGVAQHTKALGEQLQQLGHYVIYISPSASTTPELPSPHYSFEQNSVFVDTPNGSQARITFNIQENQLIELIQAHHIEVIHLQEIICPFINVAILKTHTLAALVGTTHAYWPDEFIYLNQLTGKVLHPWLIHQFDAVTTVSNACRNSNQELLGEKFFKIPPAFKVPQRVSSSYPSDWDPAKKHILFLSRLEKRKGGKQFVSALTHLPPQFLAQTVFHVAGAGPQQKIMHSLATSLPPSAIHFHGRISEEAKWQYLQHADLYVAPATHGESVGINILESLVVGTPLVFGNNPGYQETLTGYPYPEGMIDPNDDEKFAQAIMTMVNRKKATYRHWASKQLAQFDIRNTVYQYLACYTEAIRERQLKAQPSSLYPTKFPTETFNPDDTSPANSD